VNLVLVVWLFVGGTGQLSRVPVDVRFYCNVGYTPSECTAHLTQLRAVLAEVDVGELGEWTWILVRSDDWKPILRRVRRDPDSPAFTMLEARQTFLEEALFHPTPGRDRTLLEKWRVPLHDLLAFAVAHELGHALCQVRDEVLTSK